MLVVGKAVLKHGEKMLAPGTPIPEAASWPTLREMMDLGRIVDVPEPSKPETQRGQQHQRSRAGG